MNLKRIAATIVVFLAVVVAISANSAVATADTDLPSCQTTPWRSDVVHEFREGKWGYLYRVIWCVEQAKIKWAVQDVVTVVPDASDCTWRGFMANSLNQEPNSDNWLGFTMGWFSCPTADGPDGDYPWAIIHVRTDGTSAIQDHGVAPSASAAPRQHL